MSRQHTEPPQLKGFTYVKTLWSGGFSDVFLYQQELPKRLVAVKVLLTDGLTPASRAAFVAEANLMAQLSHPYIVKIYHADVSDDGRPYLIMEYLAGQNLSEQYKRHPLSVVEALRTGVRLSSAIATAHAAGVLHRDIKPANVLTNDYGHPALTDFGIASALEEELPTHTTTRASLSESGSTTGSQSVGMSIPWSPPEMFEDDPRPDIRSDVFSLSATVYTLLAGRTPFEVVGRPNQTLDLMTRIERGAITPMDRTDVPSSLLAVLRKGMATNRDQRFASAVDFARALQRVELELSYAPTPIEVANLVVPEPEARPAGGHEDETRARSITTIAPQTVGPAPSSAVPQVAVSAPIGVDGATEGVAPTVEATVVRGASATSEQTQLRPQQTQVAEPMPPAGKSRRGALIAGVIGVVVAVGVGIVVVNLLAGPTGVADSPPSEAAVDTGEDPIVGESVPSPTLVSAAPGADGASVVFTWSNPDGVADDTYVWQRTDGAGDDQRVPTSDLSAEITEVSAGTTVCVAVYVRRDGQLSPEPLKACYP